jgi:predicted nucleic acid-binding protein
VTVVIADTSPLRYLICLGLVELLPRLYGRVAIPAQVARELGACGAPAVVAEWISAPPDWLEVRELSPREGADVWPAVQLLDEGERDAILLALQENARLLLIDERAGREVADSLGIASVGVLGILVLAGREGMVDLRVAFEALARTNFRVSRRFLEQILAAEGLI